MSVKALFIMSILINVLYTCTIDYFQIVTELVFLDSLNPVLRRLGLHFGLEKWGAILVRIIRAHSLGTDFNFYINNYFGKFWAKRSTHTRNNYGCQWFGLWEVILLSFFWGEYTSMHMHSDIDIQACHQHSYMHSTCSMDQRHVHFHWVLILVNSRSPYRLFAGSSHKMGSSQLKFALQS